MAKHRPSHTNVKRDDTQEHLWVTKLAQYEATRK